MEKRFYGEVKPPAGGLKRGFTTGSCAAAGAKAAALSLFAALTGRQGRAISSVTISLPRGGVLEIPVKSLALGGKKAVATIVKDAGDDPDVTNGAEIKAEVEIIGLDKKRASTSVKGGEGVGVVTRPGLKISPGRPAINPVPLKMIKKAVFEAAGCYGLRPSVRVTISVPLGKELALKTMNPRLGITGGISILGTTGIVEPMSLAAYRHSISCAVSVALASGLDEVVYSTGRSSEKVVEDRLGLAEFAYVLTGDHMGFALRDAAKRKGLKRVTVAGQFGKFTKLASGRFETHCNDSSVEFDFLAGLFRKAGAKDETIDKVLKANTAREVFFIIKNSGLDIIFKKICEKVKKNSMEIAGPGIEVRCVLVGYGNDTVFSC